MPLQDRLAHRLFLDNFFEQFTHWLLVAPLWRIHDDALHIRKSALI
jgi:hypothetical protein